MKPNNQGMKSYINCFVSRKAVFIAFFLLITVPLIIISQNGDAWAKDKKELYEIVPASAESLIYFRDLEKGLKPLLKSDFYHDVKKMSLFKGPIKTDVSVPMLSLLGNIEEAIGIKVTVKRILYVIGERAIFYETEASGIKSWVAVIETGGFKGKINEFVSKVKKGIGKEEVLGYSPWVVSLEGRKIYYKRLSDYIVVSNSPQALLSEWEVIAGTNTNTLSLDPNFTKYISAVKGKSEKDPHVIMYHKISKTNVGETGLASRAERMISGNESLFLGVTFTKLGADVHLYSPYAPYNTEVDLRALEGRKSLDLSDIPGETAALVAFSAFDPEIIYSIFYQNWFYDVSERIKYISIVNKWKLSSGFDIEEGILKNLDGGALFALTGLGFEGREPHLLTLASVGVKGGGCSGLTFLIRASMRPSVVSFSTSSSSRERSSSCSKLYCIVEMICVVGRCRGRMK